MRHLLVAASFMAAAWTLTAGAQESVKPSVNVDFNTRFDYHYEDPNYGEITSGFRGKYFNLMLSGDITDKLSYSIRQRLNKKIDDNDVFNATDWITLTYMPTKNWAISGGKQVVAIGGYEYDAAPINVYFASMFWNNIACYQFGLSGKYISNSGNHGLMFQICNSPFQGLSSRCYAYNLMWNGKVGPWQTLWSVNMMETVRGSYAEYIALGNRFDFGPFNLELDLMQRSYEKHKFWLDDFSVIAKAEYRVCRYLTLMVKGGYEHFHPGRMGVEMNDPERVVKKPFVGAGVEVYPIKNYPNLRLHALWNKNHGAGQIFNDPATGASVNTLHTHQFIAGATWRCNLLKWTMK